MPRVIDPAVETSRLANGLRVTTVALPHLHTVTVAAFVKVGARFESPDDNGLSHFVEHMMFRGTKKYPATSIVKFLQHEGLAMGAETSAFTNYTSTFYNLDLPHNSPEKIALGTLFLPHPVTVTTSTASPRTSMK